MLGIFPECHGWRDSTASITFKLNYDFFIIKFNLLADGLVRKKNIHRQSSTDNSFPTIINVDEDMVMV